MITFHWYVGRSEERSRLSFVHIKINFTVTGLVLAVYLQYLLIVVHISFHFSNLKVFYHSYFSFLFCYDFLRFDSIILDQQASREQIMTFWELTPTSSGSSSRSRKKESKETRWSLVMCPASQQTRCSSKRTEKKYIRMKIFSDVQF